MACGNQAGRQGTCIQSLRFLTTKAPQRMDSLLEVTKVLRESNNIVEGMGEPFRATSSRQNVYDFPAQTIIDSPSGNANWNADAKNQTSNILLCVDFLLFLFHVFSSEHLRIFRNSLPLNNKLYSYTNTLVKVFEDRVIPLGDVCRSPCLLDLQNADG